MSSQTRYTKLLSRWCTFSDVLCWTKFGTISAKIFSLTRTQFLLTVDSLQSVRTSVNRHVDVSNRSSKGVLERRSDTHARWLGVSSCPRECDMKLVGANVSSPTRSQKSVIADSSEIPRKDATGSKGKKWPLEVGWNVLVWPAPASFSHFHQAPQKFKFSWNEFGYPVLWPDWFLFFRTLELSSLVLVFWPDVIVPRNWRV